MKVLVLKKVISKGLGFIDKGVETLIWAAFALMVVVGLTQVFCRYALGNSLSWSEEFQKYMHIWIIFLAIPLAYKYDGHIGMNIIYGRMARPVRWVFTLLIHIMWMGLGGVMMFYSLRIMKVAKMQTSPGLGVRMDLVYLCIVIGGGYLCLMAIRKILGHVFGVTEQGRSIDSAEGEQ